MAKKLQNKAQLYNINFRQVPATYPRNKLFLTWQSPAQPTKPTNTKASYHNTLPVFTSAAAAAGREPGWSFWHENMTRAKVAGTILYHSHPLLRAREKKQLNHHTLTPILLQGGGKRLGYAAAGQLPQQQPTINPISFESRSSKSSSLFRFWSETYTQLRNNSIFVWKIDKWVFSNGLWTNFKKLSF